MNHKNKDLFEDDSDNLNYDPATEGKNSKKGTGSIFLALAILFFILAATTAYFYFNESQKVKEIEKLKKEQEQVLKKQFEESEKARKELQASFDGSNEQISKLNDEIRAQARKIRGLIWKESQYSTIEQEINNLNKKYATLLKKANYRSDSLQVAANKYFEQYNRVTAQNQELLDKIQKYEKRIQELEGKSPITKTTETNGVSPNFKATTLDIKTFYRNKKQKEKEINKKNKINVIKITFNLSETVPKNDSKNIALAAIIKDAEGNVLEKTPSTNPVFIGGKKEKVSMKSTTKYRGAMKQYLSFIITDKKATKLTKGVHTVKVYVSEDSKNFHEIISGSFELK